MHIAIFSGSFNPVHFGHVQLAKSLLEALPVEEVWMVVSPQNPLKERMQASENDRLSMLELAIENCSRIRASKVEFFLPKPSYTIDTLRFLKRTYPEHHFSMVIGSDNVLVFNQWKDYESLLKEFPVYVFPRRQESGELPTKIYPEMQWVNIPMVDISSTEIREKIQLQHDTSALLHPKVRQYIDRQQLYR